MKLSLYLFAALMPVLAYAEASWKQQGNAVLELSDGETTLVRFVLDTALRDPHFKVLATRDGCNTVWVAPKDHIWHYGLWFSWKKINGVNFWETDGSGRQQGRNDIVDPLIEIDPDAEQATITYVERAYPEANGAAVLEDSVRIVISKPKGEMGPQVDWAITTRALEDVVLDRTPILGEPDGKSWGGYAGFSWRGTKDFKEVQFIDSKGRRNEAIHHESSQWVNVSGNVEGVSAGLLIVPHSQNPRQPSSWHIVKTDKLPFYYVNPAILLPGPIQLSKGETFTHRYRAIIHDGAWSPEQCEAAAEQYAAKTHKYR